MAGIAAGTADSRRKSYILSLPSTDVNLTAGTNIPPPRDSPPPSPVRPFLRLSRPPTAPGGPLSSHPVTDYSSMPPPALPGAFPPSPEPEKSDNTMSSESNRDTMDGGARPPTSPASMQNPAPRERRPSSVRRLFSLNSLRQSFSSSRTSLSIPPGSSYGNHNDHQRYGTPSVFSSGASTVDAPMAMHSAQNASSMRKKRSSNWFKRKSGFFSVTEDGELSITDEELSPDKRENKRFKPGALPMLPEVSTLSGGELNEGSIGWDEQLFKA